MRLEVEHGTPIALHFPDDGAPFQKARLKRAGQPVVQPNELSQIPDIVMDDQKLRELSSKYGGLPKLIKALRTQTR